MIGNPLIVRPLLVSKRTKESSADVIHVIHADSRTFEDCAVIRRKRNITGRVKK